MSVDAFGAGDDPLEGAAVQTLEDHFPEPIAHGFGVVATIDDLEDADAPVGERGGLYDAAMDYWQERVGSPDNEKHVISKFEADWLDNPEQDHVLLFYSSRWKAGEGTGDDYSAWYKYHLVLREVVEDGMGRRSLRKPPTSLSITITPQYPGLVYGDGDPLEKDLVYGTGSRIEVESAYPETGHDLIRRAHQAATHAFGAGALDLDDVVEESHRLKKAEAFVRFAREQLGAAAETVEHTKELIQWGGSADVFGMQEAEGGHWAEVKTISDRFDLLGFGDPDFKTSLKVYLPNDVDSRDDDDPMSHPKMEAGFSGADGGQLPHVSAFDAVMQYLRSIVATHCRWAGIRADDLVADGIFDGPDAEPFRYDRPEGRKDMLRERYEDVATDIYREALKERTDAVYDVLKVIAEEGGANYDMLERQTGLARRTVRHHVRRLEDLGIVHRHGNPVWVLWSSELVEDRANEILDEVKPGDMPEDRWERAQERRERREEQEDDDADEEDVELSASADPELGFAYLDEIEAEIEDVQIEHFHGRLTDEDIRVRQDALRPGLR